MASTLELGLDTFGDVTRGSDGRPEPHARVIRNVVEQAVLADRVGIDYIGVGEHHREDFAISAPEVVLAAIAARTQRIRMGSAVTVLSSDDPVRVFERFSTLQAIASGRAEVMLGRGSFIESFPLFGYDLSQYEQLFDEKLDLFARLLEEGVINWQGSMRPPLVDARVFPRLEHGKLVTWIGVGGTPESVLRAARYDMPVMFAVIGGDPARFRSLAELYARARRELGRPQLPVGLHSPGYVGETDARAREEFFADYKAMHERIGAERGWQREMTRAEFDREIERGALFVGSPETVARKIAAAASALGLSRFNLKYSAGMLPHDRLMSCIALYGERVAPLVRAELDGGAER